mgnify:CR=1 FL=1
MLLLNSQKNDYLNGLLVKWLNTLPSQGSIHGFEFRTGYHFSILSQFIAGFFFLKKLEKIIQSIYTLNKIIGGI